MSHDDDSTRSFDALNSRGSSSFRDDRKNQPWGGRSDAQDGQDSSGGTSPYAYGQSASGRDPYQQNGYGQNGYGQSSYGASGQYGQNSYGQPAHNMYGQPQYAMQPVEHPDSTLVLILGLVGLVFGPTAIVGLVIGERARRAIQRGEVPYLWGGTLKAGWVVSLIVTVLCVLGVLLFIGYFVFMIAMIGSFATSGTMSGAI